MIHTPLPPDGWTLLAVLFACFLVTRRPKETARRARPSVTGARCNAKPTLAGQRTRSTVNVATNDDTQALFDPVRRIVTLQPKPCQQQTQNPG